MSIKNENFVNKMRNVTGSFGSLVAVILVVSVIWFIVKNNNKPDKKKYSMSPITDEEIMRQVKVVPETVAGKENETEEPI